MAREPRSGVVHGFVRAFMLACFLAPLGTATFVPSAAAANDASASGGADPSFTVAGDMGASTTPERLLAAAASLTVSGAGGLPLVAALERDGALPAGAVAWWLASAAPGVRGPPPNHVFQDARPICDVDGDGVDDVVVNRLQPLGRPNLQPAYARVEVHSGANGTLLWDLDNLLYVVPSFPGVDYGRGAEPAWMPPSAVEALPDVDRDGACDLALVGWDSLNFVSVPFVGGADVTDYTTRLMVASGRTGEAVWTRSYESRAASAQDPLLGSAFASSVTGLPTGFRVVNAPTGPRLFLKTSDISATSANDPVGLTAVVPVLDGAAFAEDVRVVEHLHLLDLATGDVTWTRDLVEDQDPKATIVSWLGATPDLSGDGEPDVLVEQTLRTNPRGNRLDDPLTGETRADAPRGLRVVALDGNPEGSGERLWTQVIIDHEVVRPNAEFEELDEVLAWSHTQALEDITGDDLPDVGLRYLVLERGLGGTLLGSVKTHVVPLEGATGLPRWDTRVQGWAVMETLRAGADGIVAVASADIPVRGAPGGSAFRVAETARLHALASADGDILWSHTAPFPVSGNTAYSTILGQFLAGIAPLDLDGDGLRDPLSSPHAEAATDLDQVLLSHQGHEYEVLDAASGERLATLGAWGAVGMALACPGDEEGFLTFLGGHARRLDITRMDLRTGETVWRVPLFNDPAPHAATAGVALSGLLGRCEARGDGTLFVAANLARDSFERGYEVIGFYGVLDAATGAPEWRVPELYGDPPLLPFFRPFARLADAPLDYDDPSLLVPAGVGVVVGGGGVPLLRALARRRRGKGFAGLAALSLVALMAVGALAPMAAGGALDENPVGAVASVTDGPPSAAPFAPPTQAPEVPTGAVTPAQWVAERAAGMVPRGLAAATAAGSVEGIDRFFEEEDSMSYTWEIGDVDGDGVEDVLLDTYCLYNVDIDCLRVGGGDILGDPVGWVEGWVFEYTCTVFHKMFAVSGRDASILWYADLDHPADLAIASNHCVFEYVLGTFPIPGADVGILSLRYEQITDLLLNSEERYVHNFTLTSARTGAALWSVAFNGVMVDDFYTRNQVADSVVVNPYLVLERDASGEATTPFLYFQGIGWRLTHEDSLVHFVDGLVLPNLNYVDRYQPDEWAARVDPATGEVLWRSATFAPAEGRSVRPVLMDLPGDWYWDDFQSLVPSRLHTYYWDHEACCGDLTGDGVPDLFYRAVEWSPTPLANTQGPYELSTRIVAFDGADGARLFDQPFADDVAVRVGRPVAATGDADYRLRPQAFGDVNGDGKDDVLLHEDRIVADYRRAIEARSGADGARLWRNELADEAATLVVGDVTGDGAPDFVVAEWASLSPDVESIPRHHLLKVHSGADGTEVARYETLAASVDIVYQFSTLRLNGLPDLDGDGVNDLLLDDPVYLDDQTMVHHLTAVSPANGKTLWATYAVGTFGHVVTAPDVDGDGVADLGVVSGDANDLWFTVHGGADGSALWSRRLLALPMAGYLEAIPRVKLDALHNATAGASDLLVTFHMFVVTSAYGEVICFGCEGETVQRGTYLYRQTRAAPQVGLFRAATGDLAWDTPGILEGDLARSVPGPTPATNAFLDWLHERRAPWTTQAAEATVAALPSLGSAAVGAALAAVAALTIIWIRNRDAGVPDLDL